MTVRSFVSAVAVRPLVKQFGTYTLAFSYEAVNLRTYERTLVARLEVGEEAGGPSARP